MAEGRIVVIPFLQGKLNFDGTVMDPDIDAIFEKWLARHSEFQGPERDYQTIRGRTVLLDEEEGVEVDLVRVTAAVSPDLAQYDPSEDADLYEDFLVAEENDSPPPLFRKIWIEQCEGAERIEADYGTEKALGYLIGEKLLSFLEVADTKPEWRAEVPLFIAKIKDMFEPWQIAEFLDTPRRLGTLGHTADEEVHEKLRSQVDESENLREDARNLVLFEQARQWLLGGDEVDE